ncbi:MAG: protease modulator HflK, partial [Chloroflexi bacterium]|nr:protease modulator HflK [Chloroflexota bacterium]
MSAGRNPDPNRGQQDIDVDRLLESVGPVLQGLRKGLGANGSRLIVPGIALLAVLWLASGIYIVGPDERGVVRHFGAFAGMTDPGLRWHIPTPVQEVDKVNVTQVRRMELGFRSARGGVVRETEESLMITGDENIVDVQMILQYRVTEPDKFLFRVWDPEGPPDQRTLRDASEAALRLVVGQRGIDDVLTVEKAAVQEDTKTVLQE